MSWGWPAVITVDTSGNSTATSVGTDLAKLLTDFSADPKKTMGKIKKQNYVYRGEVSKQEDLAPVSKYIMNDDVVALFVALYTGYDKEELLSDDNLLESFFDSAEAGKDLLEFETFDTVVVVIVVFMHRTRSA